MNKKLSTRIAVLVVIVWAVSMFVDMVPTIEYDPPVGIYPAVMLALGVIFGINVTRTNGS